MFLIGKVGKLKTLKLKVLKFLISKGLFLSLAISVLATFGSLYFSEILKLPPCKLCWYQRIFMYPQAVLFLTAVVAKSNEVFKYSLPLSLMGAFIALRHYYLQINPNPYAPCDILGYSVSCTEKFTVYFGFITIPWMAFSSFIALSLLAYLSLKDIKLLK